MTYSSLSFVTSLSDVNLDEDKISDLKNGKKIWQEIITDYMEKRKAWDDYYQKKNSKIIILKDQNSGETELEYLNREVFPILLPALVDTLYEAIKWDVLKVQKSIFNGIDYVVERIWNLNPRHIKRQKNYLKIFCIPFVKRNLKERPRPIYPLSWIWSREEASLIIQSYVRGWMVRKQTEIQELRQFWKSVKKEKLDEENKRIEQKKIKREMKILLKKNARIQEKVKQYIEDLKLDRKQKDIEENIEIEKEEIQEINYYDEFSKLSKKDYHYKVYPSPTSFDSNN